MISDKSNEDVLGALKSGIAVGGVGAMATGLASLVGLTSATYVAPVGIAVACLAAIGHRWKTQGARVAMEQAREWRRRFGELENRVAETQGLVQLSGVAPPFPLPFGGNYALTADAGAVLARQVLLLRPRLVVELGSGVSTVLIARLMQQLGGGRIVSLESDADWAMETRRQIRAADLEPYAVVAECPLREQVLEGQRYQWYDMSNVRLNPGEVDLVIVDGPPQRLDPEGAPRYPALPMLAPYLSERAEFFVDDAAQPPQKRMVSLWLERFPGWQSRFIETVPGTCLLWQTRASRLPAH